MSGILDLARHPKSWELPRVFGPYQGENRAVWQAHSAVDLAQKNAEYLRTLPLLVTVSISDQAALPDNRRFHKTLESLNIPHQYQESSGGHDWDYWLKQLPDHLTFHARRLHDPVK
jgi:S-formylglutathione hydrolase FrmB